MNLEQHRELADYMNTLTDLQERMNKSKDIFPNYYNELKDRYNQILFEARFRHIVPPWMAA